MEIFLISILVFALAVLGMCVGVLCGRARIKGSCGGLNVPGLEGECQVCSRSCERKKTKDSAPVAHAPQKHMHPG